jgi:hypothetical protein
MAAVNGTSKINLDEVGRLEIKPSEAIVLTGELDMKKLCEIICHKAPNNSMICLDELEVDISGLKGIDVGSAWKAAASSGYFLTIVSSSLGFFYMGNSPGQYQCNEKTMLRNLTTSSGGSFFNHFGHFI